MRKSQQEEAANLFIPAKNCPQSCLGSRSIARIPFNRTVFDWIGHDWFWPNLLWPNWLWFNLISLYWFKIKLFWLNCLLTVVFSQICFDLIGFGLIVFWPKVHFYTFSSCFYKIGFGRFRHAYCIMKFLLVAMWLKLKFSTITPTTLIRPISTRSIDPTRSDCCCHAALSPFCRK